MRQKKLPMLQAILAQYAKFSPTDSYTRTVQVHKSLTPRFKDSNRTALESVSETPPTPYSQYLFLFFAFKISSAILGKGWFSMFTAPLPLETHFSSKVISLVCKAQQTREVDFLILGFTIWYIMVLGNFYKHLICNAILQNQSPTKYYSNATKTIHIKPPTCR